MKGDCTVLWAEDDQDDKALIVEAADSLHLTHLIDFVSNGKDALLKLEESLLDQNLPSLVVLDNNMPILTGFETFKLIRTNECLSHIPIAFFSSVTSGVEIEIIKKDAKVFQKPSVYSGFFNIVPEIMALRTRIGSA